MKIRHTPIGDLDVLALSGEFDSGSAPQFDDQVERLIADYRPQILVDLSDVTFMDSLGVTRLIHAHRRLKPLGGRLLVAGASRIVQMTLKTVGLEALVPMFPNVEEARYYFTDPARARSIDMDGVPVDEALLGRIDVEIGLAGERGKTATGKLLATYDDGLMVRCSESELFGSLGIESLDPGQHLWVRFHQPMLARGHEFDVEARIVLSFGDGDEGKYRLRFTRISDRDVKLMREFSRAQDDMRTYGKPLEGV